jgi:hypothetical protein
MDAQAHGQTQARVRQTRIEVLHGRHHAQPGMHGALGVVFVRLRPAKIHQQAVAKILRDMAGVALDDVGTGLLIGPQHGTQVFGVELARETRGVSQVAEQHRELAPFGLRWWGGWRG